MTKKNKKLQALNNALSSGFARAAAATTAATTIGDSAVRDAAEQIANAVGTVVNTGNAKSLPLGRFATICGDVVQANGLTEQDWPELEAALLGARGAAYKLSRSQRRACGISDKATSLPAPVFAAAKPARKVAAKKPTAKKPASDKPKRQGDGKMAIAVTTEGELLVGARKIAAAVEAGATIAAEERAYVNAIRMARHAYRVRKNGQWKIGRACDMAAEGAVESKRFAL